MSGQRRSRLLGQAAAAERSTGAVDAALAPGQVQNIRPPARLSDICFVAASCTAPLDGAAWSLASRQRGCRCLVAASDPRCRNVACSMLTSRTRPPVGSQVPAKPLDDSSSGNSTDAAAK